MEHGSGQEQTACWPSLLLDPVATHETPCLWSADQQRQIAAELSYMQGHYLQAYHQLEGVREEAPGALSALTLRAAALVSSGDAASFPQAWNRLKIWHERHAGDRRTQSLVELAQGLLAVSAYALDDCPGWLLEGDIAPLPAESGPLAMYIRAKAMHAQNRMDRLAGLVDSALCLIPGASVIKAYLYLMQACSALYAHQTSKAEEAVHRAIDICLPQGLVSPLAETLHALLGLVERCLKARSPAMYRQALILHKQLSLSWLSVHNYLAKKQLTLLLTRREYQVALAACDGQSNQSCADQLGMSCSTFKGHLEVIYQKLNITSRKALKEFVSSN